MNQSQELRKGAVKFPSKDKAFSSRAIGTSDRETFNGSRARGGSLSVLCRVSSRCDEKTRSLAMDIARAATPIAPGRYASARTSVSPSLRSFPRGKHVARSHVTAGGSSARRLSLVLRRYTMSRRARCYFSPGSTSDDRELTLNARSTRCGDFLTVPTVKRDSFAIPYSALRGKISGCSSSMSCTNSVSGSSWRVRHFRQPIERRWFTSHLSSVIFDTNHICW